MEMIKHDNPKYGWFVGYMGVNPVWNPELGKAVKSFSNFLVSHPSLTPKKLLDVLNRDKFHKGKVSLASL